MSLFTPKPTRYALAGALVFAILTCLRPQPPELRGPLLEIRGHYQRSLAGSNSNLRNQFTPGFKKRSPWEPQALIWTQGEIFKTQTATHLAVNGEGCFGLRAEGRTAYTRDGRFSFRDGTLRNAEDWELQGVPLDRLGNISGEPGPLKLDLDPQTRLYDSRFTGFHFDETGKLFGEQTQTNPFTGQSSTRIEPLYQVLLYQFPNPAGLDDLLSSANLWSETPLSGRPLAGIAGQGCLGGLCPASLELSNVDFMNEGTALSWVGEQARAYQLRPGRSQLDQELGQRMSRDPRFCRAALENIENQLRPGYRSWDILKSLTEGGELRLRTNQARYFATGNPLDVALHGEGYLVLQEGQLTRNGHLLLSPQGLRSDGALLMGYPAGRTQLEPVRLPATAANLEITARGQVRWTDFNGEGKPVEGYRLALARPEGVGRSGLHLRPEGRCEIGVPGPGMGVSLEQGALEASNLDPYEHRLLAPALLDLAGLPPFDLR